MCINDNTNSASDIAPLISELDFFTAVHKDVIDMRIS